MPAKTVIFDQRVRPLHDFGMAPHNFISFNPQGRLIALAGFGNLAGKIDVIDRRTLTKVCTIDAPNTSYCDWSPDGRFLLTATLSPRLRVDNGIKIWHCTGPLIHIQVTDELYHTAWRPTPVESFPQFGQTIPPAPIPSESVKSFRALQKPTPAKSAGAYRPPGARGLATPSIFKREDEGGPGTHSGNATPPRYNRSPVPGAPGYGHQNGQDGYLSQNGTKRHVPGAPPSGSPSPAPENAKNRKKKKKPQKQDGIATGASTPGEGVALDGAIQAESQDQGNGKKQDGQQHEVSKKGVDNEQGGTLNVHIPAARTDPVPDVVVQAPVTPEGALDPVAKKARNLNKKVCPVSLILPEPATNPALQLKAIEELKEKAKRGERLEATQMRKIEGEAEIRRELATLEVGMD